MRVNITIGTSPKSDNYIGNIEPRISYHTCSALTTDRHTWSISIEMRKYDFLEKRGAEEAGEGRMKCDVSQ